MIRHDFDAVVIGSGSSAYYAIDGLNQDRRFKIAVGDERPYGGTCALRGCQPKKYLVTYIPHPLTVIFDNFLSP